MTNLRMGSNLPSRRLKTKAPSQSHWGLRLVKGSAFYVSFLIFSFALILTGCASKALVQNVQFPYQTVKSVVMQNMPIRVVSQSTNGREMRSDYFAPNDLDQEAKNRSERAYAVATILNSSRPFHIDIQVFREKKTKSGRYVQIGKDPKMAQRLAARFKEALADRREDRNVIDDFRAF